MGLPQGGILGREAEGTILSTGPGNYHNLNLKIGDRVVWLAIGGYAEYTSVPAALAYKIPSEIKPGVAAAAQLQGLTAFILTHEVYQVQKDDWVLVHAAAGGVGLWLCQILKSLGAHIIGTASTAEKTQLAEENGAGWTINYKEEKELAKRVMEITNGRGVKVVYDSIGKDQFENNLEVVAKNGIIVNYGASSGIGPPVPLAVLAAKNIKVIPPGVTAVMNYLYSREQYEKWCTKLFDFIVKDKANVRIHDTYALSEVVKAHADLEGRKTTGKVLMKP